MEQQVFTLTEVSRIIGISKHTLRKEIAAGKLKAMGRGSKKNIRISQKDLEAYYQAQGGGALFENTPRTLGPASE